MNRIRVVLVDDDPGIREVFAELLEAEDGLEVAGTAEDAESGIELVVDQLPDVALVDVRMSGGGGPRAAEAIVTRSPETRVVALSAYADRGAVLEMLRAGAIGYLVKGCPREELVEAIRRAAGGKGTLSAEITADVVEELATHLDNAERETSVRRRRTERIRQVLDGGLLRIVYQPIVDVSGREPIGYEALARFPVRFGRPSNVWFAEAAELGLGEELELEAVALALEALSELPSAAFLSVNLSPATVTGERCAKLLGEVDCGRLVVEMTEHAAVDDYRTLESGLADLRNRGVRVAVDDTGAGFASLRHILQLSPEFVKLDISLTRGIADDASRRALAAALVAFAEELGAGIIAEGVERQEELEALAALRVPYAQGYLLGRPGALAPDTLTG